MSGIRPDIKYSGYPAQHQDRLSGGRISGQFDKHPSQKVNLKIHQRNLRLIGFTKSANQ